MTDLFTYITSAVCGHTTKRILDGPLATHTATIARIAARPCRDCQRAATRAKMDAAAEAADAAWLAARGGAS